MKPKRTIKGRSPDHVAAFIGVFSHKRERAELRRSDMRNRRDITNSSKTGRRAIKRDREYLGVSTIIPPRHV